MMRTHLSTQQLIEKWLQSKDVAEATRNTYRRVFAQFQRWIVNENIRIRNINRAHYIQFKQYLIENKSIKTADLYLTTVRSYFRWLAHEKIHEDITYGVRNPKRQKQFVKMPLQPDQAKKLLATIPRNTIRGMRDYAMINLMMRSGIRTIEAARLDVGDIEDKNGNWVIRFKGKGQQDKRSVVPLTHKSLEPIHNYLLMRDDFTDNDPLFTRHAPKRPPGRLCSIYIGSLVKHYLRLSGIDDKKYTAHSLRHTAAYNMLKGGASEYDVQLLLRHSSPAITQTYLRLIEQEKAIQNPACKILDNIL